MAPRKYTTLVRTPTKRKRAKILNKVRSYVAGRSETADTQLATELKALSTTRRQHIVQMGGGKANIFKTLYVNHQKSFRNELEARKETREMA